MIQTIFFKEAEKQHTVTLANREMQMEEKTRITFSVIYFATFWCDFNITEHSQVRDFIIFTHKSTCLGTIICGCWFVTSHLSHYPTLNNTNVLCIVQMTETLPHRLQYRAAVLL